MTQAATIRKPEKKRGEGRKSLNISIKVKESLYSSNCQKYCKVEWSDWDMTLNGKEVQAHTKDEKNWN